MKDSEPIVCYKHKARVLSTKNGSAVVPYDFKQVQSDINDLKGQEVFFVLYSSHEPSSPGQMAYYRGVMLKKAITTEQYSGQTKDELHNDLLSYFNVETLKGMSWNRMNEWIEDCKNFFIKEENGKLEFEDDNKYMEIK